MNAPPVTLVEGWTSASMLAIRDELPLAQRTIRLQSEWKHSISKVKDAGPRLNLTFRMIAR